MTKSVIVTHLPIPNKPQHSVIIVTSTGPGGGGDVPRRARHLAVVGAAARAVATRHARLLRILRRRRTRNANIRDGGDIYAIPNCMEPIPDLETGLCSFPLVKLIPKCGGE